MNGINGLVLARRVGERILIGDDITIEIVSVDSGRARLLIDAPRNLKVLRTELVNAENQQRESCTSKTDVTLRRERGREVEPSSSVPAPAVS
jgi:carbon storage regulator